MARTDTLGNFLTDVAEAIRTKKGTTGTIPANTFDTEIASIEGGSSKYAPRYISFYAYIGTDLDEEIANLDTTNITSMAYMFYNNNNLQSLDLSNFNTSNVTSMYSMFLGCKSITTLDLTSFNTSNVTKMSNMFNNCLSLTTLKLTNFNTSNVTDMSDMFNNCKNLTTLDLTSFNTSNVTSMSYMFNNCLSLTTLKLTNFNTSNVTDMSDMFNNCLSLTTLKLTNFDTSKVTIFYKTFYRCNKIVSIPKLNASRSTNVSFFAYDCVSLTDFGGLENLGQAYSTTTSANNSSYKLDLSNCTALTEQSLINVLTNLYDIATKGCKTQQVVLGSTNLEKLTSEEGQSALAQATSYGWTIS